MIKVSFQSGDDVQLQDINDAAGVLKQYLRQLPEPLIPYQHYPQYIAVCSRNNSPCCPGGALTGNAAVQAVQVWGRSLVSTLTLLLVASPRTGPNASQSCCNNSQQTTSVRLLSQCADAVADWCLHMSDTLNYLIRFLAELTRYETSNKMNAKNIAIVFAPNLLRPEVETPQVGVVAVG